MSTQTRSLVAVDVTIGDVSSLHGPMTEQVADRFLTGVQAAGGTATKRPLQLDDPDWSVASSSMWPPRGYLGTETASYYVDPLDRWVVSFLQGFDEESDVSSAQDAADAALWDIETQRPTWYVFDRHEGAMYAFTQRSGDDPARPFPRRHAILTGAQLKAVQAVIAVELEHDPESRVLDPATWQASGYGDAGAYEDHAAALHRADEILRDAASQPEALTTSADALALHDLVAAALDAVRNGHTDVVAELEQALDITARLDDR